MTTTYRHRPGCTGERMESPRIGREGDTLIGCRNCRMLTVIPARDLAAGVTDVTPAPEPDYATASQTARTGSPYRCRSHHETPVDRRGRGCPLCQLETTR